MIYRDQSIGCIQVAISLACSTLTRLQLTTTYGHGSYDFPELGEHLEVLWALGRYRLNHLRGTSDDMNELEVRNRRRS